MKLLERHRVQTAAARLAGELTTTRAVLAATPYDSPARRALETRSQDLFRELQQMEPDHPALTPPATIKRSPAAVVASLDAEAEVERVFSSTADDTEIAAELRTVRAEIALVAGRLDGAQAVEARATGAALVTAKARSIALIAKREALTRRSLALSERLRATWPNHPALRAVVAPVDVRA